MDFTIRKATQEDLPEVLALVTELAVYEKAGHEVTITLEELEKDGFGETPLYWIILAENDNGILGMSFYYIRYSTWKGRCLYLEDIVVKEEHRGQKIGKVLFEETIKAAKEMNAKLMTWQVLDWNEPAINFYKKFNAELDGEWINGKLRF
ncbi:GNAT family N-acetyltransferase [Vicingus serpentipes]|uniref:GNAT family N-acetyltransferase n=1 Tax=Vicingus serpentipes TaxID=1926625 RepID=A0A5C6RZV4_9FLAO|nr:GNAT family N-acetyltransferase [Vicingus serpentipes]TXB67170.1 GNAT family N-acetyltransferase [Vicingus serpentipes]